MYSCFKSHLNTRQGRDVQDKAAQPYFTATGKKRKTMIAHNGNRKTCLAGARIINKKVFRAILVRPPFGCAWFGWFGWWGWMAIRAPSSHLLTAALVTDQPSCSAFCTFAKWFNPPLLGRETLIRPFKHWFTKHI